LTLSKLCFKKFPLMLDYIEMYNLKRLKKVVTRTCARHVSKNFFGEKI